MGIPLPSQDDWDEEQNNFFLANQEKSCVITGPPGSGKTVMAIHRAHMLQQTSHTVGLQMFHNNLKDFCTSALTDLGIDKTKCWIGTHHAWLTRIYKNNGLRNFPRGKERFDVIYEEVIKDFVDHKVKFEDRECTIIDEGQDLDNKFYLLLGHTLRAKQLNICITADENQSIREKNSTINDIFSFTGIFNTFHLSNNHRNTLPIAELAAHFYTGDPSGTPNLPSRSGDKPLIFKDKTIANSAYRVAIWQKNHPQSTGGVFFWRRSDLKGFEKELRKKLRGNELQVQYSSYRGNFAVNWDEPGIKLITYNSCKGLEFDHVFMPEMQKIAWPWETKQVHQMFYVAISRARNDLTMMYTGAEIPAIIRNNFPPDLVDYI